MTTRRDLLLGAASLMLVAPVRAAGPKRPLVKAFVDAHGEPLWPRHFTEIVDTLRIHNGKDFLKGKLCWSMGAYQYLYLYALISANSPEFNATKPHKIAINGIPLRRAGFVAPDDTVYLVRSVDDGEEVVGTIFHLRVTEGL